MKNSAALSPPRSGERRDAQEVLAPLLWGPSNQGIEDRIENALANLRSGEQCIISAEGGIFSDRQTFLRSGQKPLLTFDKRSNGNEVSIYSGLPSANGTFTGAGRESIDTNVILGAHDSFIIGGVRIVLPDARLTSPQTDAHGRETENIVRDIAALSEGESVTLGRRTYHELPSLVSRVHAIVTRQNDIGGQPSFILTDGIPGAETVMIQPSENDPAIPLFGRKSLAAGARIVFTGNRAPITVPEAAPSPGEIDIEQSYSEGMKLGFTERVKGIELSQQSIFSGSLFGVSLAAVVYPDMVVSPLEAGMIGIHVREGLKLIQQEKYKEAYGHFSNPSVLKAAGYYLQENHYFSLKEISGREIVKVLQRVAADSWFFPGDRRVYPSWAGVDADLKPENAREEQLLKDFHRELCLITAEEWIHGLQHALNSNVSRKGALIDGLSNAHEIDVAQFMAEQRIPLSYEFLHNRYPERGIVLKKLESFQTPAEVNGVSEKIALLRIGQTLRIGTREGPEGQESSGQYQYWQIGAKPEDGDSIRGNPDYKNLSELHVEVTKLSTGYFSLTAISPGKVYAQDVNRIWHKVDSSIILEPGAKFRLGRFFELRMPEVNIGEDLMGGVS